MPIHQNILIADDDADTRDLLRHVIEPKYRATTRTSSVELLEALAEPPAYALIIVDVDMDWIDGISAMSTARAAGVRTPVIVISGRKELALLQRVVGLTNAHFLAKPFSPAALMLMISAIVLQ